MSSFLCFIKLIDTKEMTFKAFWKAKLVYFNFVIFTGSRRVAINRTATTTTSVKEKKRVHKVEQI
jgi:hypothetical protein